MSIRDLNGDGVITEEDRLLFKHSALDEKPYRTDLIVKGHPWGFLFAQGGDVLRERLIATWTNTSLLTALFMTFTIPGILTPPDIHGTILNIFVTLNLIAFLAQLFGLWSTIQLVVHMDRVMGSAGAAAYASYPRMFAALGFAYSMSFGVNLVFTLAAIVTAAIGLYDWQALVAPAIFGFLCLVTLLWIIWLTNAAHSHALKVVNAATLARTSAGGGPPVKN